MLGKDSMGKENGDEIEGCHFKQWTRRVNQEQALAILTRPPCPMQTPGLILRLTSSSTSAVRGAEPQLM